ncbi:MAG: hypothetical protein K2O42_08340 [Oscillospiraceae bacterium]|nr:hypothetical protein [Oscillospiraceae bacterium]
MEKTRIVITNGKENIGVFLNNPEATTKELLMMHCCLVNVIIRDMVARGMTVTEAIEAIGCSNNDAIRMYYAKDMKGEE